MRRWTLLLAGGLLITSGCGDRKADPGVTEEPAPVPTAAVEVTGVELGKAVGPDKAITEATTSFGPMDTIYVSVRTEGMASSATLAARWTYENGQVVDESSQTIAPTGPEVTEFHISKPDGWPAGTYEVTIALDGQPVGTQSFTVES